MPKYTERAAGIYRATYLGCKETTFEDKETKEDVTRWVWAFQDVTDSTTAGVIDQMTGTSLKSPNSNAYKIASGIMGHKLQPGDDTETHIGDTYDVVYGPNQAGNLAITGVVPVGTPTAPAGGASPTPPVSASGVYEGMEGYGNQEPKEAPGDLPF